MMKKTILNLLTIMGLLVTLTARADIDCDPMMNDPSQVTAACQCIWTNVYNGCISHAGTPPSACGRILFNQLKSATDTQISTLYCNPRNTADVQGCTDSLDYFRTSGTGANYSAHNCPCPDSHCQ